MVGYHQGGDAEAQIINQGAARAVTRAKTFTNSSNHVWVDTSSANDRVMAVISEVTVPRSSCKDSFRRSFESIKSAPISGPGVPGLRYV